MTDMLKRSGWDIRNSSIRAKQANQQRLDRGEIPERTLKRLLRMKISWSQTVIVVIGRETHASTWVDYEIQEANRQGKRIVGVYARGLQDAQLPESLEKYASAIVAWNTDALAEAIDGGENRFEDASGLQRQPVNNPTRQNC
jgi:hypothetical protein